MPHREFYVDIGKNRLRPGTGEDDWFSHPIADNCQGKYRGCISMHGSGGLSQSGFNYLLGGSLAMTQMLCGRFPTCSGDMGYNNWGNDAAIGAMEVAHTELIARGAANAPMLLVAGSMGNLPTLRYAKKHPSHVAAIIHVIPALDIVELRTLQPATRADQDAAWGITYPAGFPVANPPANPKDFWVDIAALNVPILVLSSSNDGIISNATALAYAAAVGADFVDLGLYGHSEASVYLAVDPMEKWIIDNVPAIV